MAATRQHLPPCCHAVHIDRKDTPKVRFKTELSKYAVAGKTDALARLAQELTATRSALQLDQRGTLGPSSSSSDGPSTRFQDMEQLQAHLKGLHEYLALIQGFLLTPASLLPSADTQAPVLESVVAPGNGDQTGASLKQPLLATNSPGTDMHKSRTKCLSFCSWVDVLSNTSTYTPNARIEYAQALLASGLLLMTEARAKIDAMLAERLTEIREDELKMGYQLLLHAAGVFHECLASLGVKPLSSHGHGSDSGLQEPPPHEKDPTEAGDAPEMDADRQMQQWRDEQRKAGSQREEAPPVRSLPTGSSIASSSELALLDRLPDLAYGHFPQALVWLALAQAQELVVLRGISRDFVDYTLMGKLAMDLSIRYKTCHTLVASKLPCATSTVADRLRLFCSFKDAYYVALSSYFQGAACMETEDARHCAQAIANLKRASVLIREASVRRVRYDAKLTGKLGKERQFVFKSVYVRSEEIIQRDLDIMTRRNDSVYYERIPDPEAPSQPVSLVRAVALPAVEAHALWHDADVATCLHATDPRAAAAATRAAPAARTAPVVEPGSGGCCDGCVIS